MGGESVEVNVYGLGTGHRRGPSAILEDVEIVGRGDGDDVLLRMPRGV